MKNDLKSLLSAENIQVLVADDMAVIKGGGGKRHGRGHGSSGKGSGGSGKGRGGSGKGRGSSGKKHGGHRGHGHGWGHCRRCC
jgi:hypothetical protein